MSKFQIFTDGELSMEIEADYYSESWINRDLHFYRRQPKKMWQRNRDVLVGHFESKIASHVSVKQVS